MKQDDIDIKATECDRHVHTHLGLHAFFTKPNHANATHIFDNTNFHRKGTFHKNRSGNTRIDNADKNTT